MWKRCVRAEVAGEMRARDNDARKVWCACTIEEIWVVIGVLGRRRRTPRSNVVFTSAVTSCDVT